MGPTKYHEMAVETVETIVGKTGTCESAVLGEPNVERLSRPERARPMARHSPKKRCLVVLSLHTFHGIVSFHERSEVY